MAWWDHYDLIGNPEVKKAMLEDREKLTAAQTQALARQQEDRLKAKLNRIERERVYKEHYHKVDMVGGWHSERLDRVDIVDPVQMTGSDHLLSMIRMRLRMRPPDDFGFKVMYAAEVGDRVHVFIVSDKEPVVLTDDTTLFPSDQLITQIRLMRT